MDEINVLVCGGASVGKSSLLQRLCEMKQTGEHHETLGINRVQVEFPLNNARSVTVNIYDIGSDQMKSHPRSHLLQYLIERCDIVFMVIDGKSASSLEEMDNWLSFLSDHFTSQRVVKYLLVNKADLRSVKNSVLDDDLLLDATGSSNNNSNYITSRRGSGGSSNGNSSSRRSSGANEEALSEDSLEHFVEEAAFYDWAYTVSFPALGDFVAGRGSASKQQSFTCILTKLITVILLRRSHSFYKLWNVPHRLDFSQWLFIETIHFEAYFRQLIGYD